MISKNEVKYIQSLSDKKNRDVEGVFVAEGPKLVNELLANGLLPKLIYTSNSSIPDNTSAAFVKEINQQELQRLSGFETAKEIIAVFYKKKMAPVSVAGNIILMLDGIQDPGNLGTIIRTADWFGIKQIIASPDTADCFNSKVVQSTMGSIARVDVHYLSLREALAGVQVPVIGALLNGTNLYEMKKIQEGIIIIGNESKGIRSSTLPFIKQAVTIPRVGKGESLNAAVAAGILLSHFIHISV